MGKKLTRVVIGTALAGTALLSTTVPARGITEYSCRERYPTAWDYDHMIPDIGGSWYSPSPHDWWPQGCSPAHNAL